MERVYPSIDQLRDSIQSSPEKKWGATVGIVTIVALSIVAIAYTACGFSPLTLTHSVFKPLESIHTIGLSVILVSWSVVGTVGILSLIVIHKPASEPRPNETSSSSQTFLEALSPDFKKLCKKVRLPQIHKDAIEKFLEFGPDSYLDHYGFYYHLASLTETIKSQENPEFITLWEAFLKRIDQSEIEHQGNYHDIRIDSSIELLRLNDQLPQLTLEELTIHSPTLESDLQTMFTMYREAFSGLHHIHYILPKEQLKKIFFPQNKNRTHTLIRNKDGNVVGMIGVDKLTIEGRPTLFFHTLARSPNAVKLGMTNQLSVHFKQAFQEIESNTVVWCEVLKKNAPAQYIYQKLGFELTREEFLMKQSKSKDCYVMKYIP